MKKILIIDDEENIQKSISDLLSAAGYHPISCSNPIQALSLVKEHSPHLILLDIWMPEMDGQTVLKQIKQTITTIPIIIISGHASVATTLEIAKSGADDFIEKPFSKEQLLRKINHFLKGEETPDPLFDSSSINSPLLLPSQGFQATIRKSCVLKGKGLHTGAPTGIILTPMPPDTGIIFEDLSSKTIIKALINNVDTTSFSTNLNRMGIGISVIEHLLSALSATGITNISVKVNKEIPILDGSAIDLVQLILENEIEVQSVVRREIVIDKTYEIINPIDPTQFIKIEPYDGFSLSYRLEIAKINTYQQVSFDLTNDRLEIFKKEIAPARTFGFIEELKGLQEAGLGQGGDMDNFLMLDGEKPVNTELRFPDELARHKVLDMIGDMYLLGFPVRGKLTACKTGHRHNIQLIKKILE